MHSSIQGLIALLASGGFLLVIHTSQTAAKLGLFGWSPTPPAPVHWAALSVNDAAPCWPGAPGQARRQGPPPANEVRPPFRQLRGYEVLKCVPLMGSWLPSFGN